MASEDKPDKAEMQRALAYTSGLIGPAARLLGISRRTLERRIEEDDSLRVVIDDANATLSDIAYAHIIQKIVDGHLPTAWSWLLRFSPDFKTGRHISEVLNEKEQAKALKNFLAFLKKSHPDEHAVVKRLLDARSAEATTGHRDPG